MILISVGYYRIGPTLRRYHHLFADFRSSLLSVAMAKTMTNATWAEKNLFSSQVTIHPWGNPKQELKAGTEVEKMEECCVLAFSSWLIQLAFLYNPRLSATTQDDLPRGGATHNGLCSSTTIINLKKISHRSAYSPIKWKHFLNQGSLFPDDSSIYPVDKYLTNTGIFFIILSININSMHIP